MASCQRRGNPSVRQISSGTGPAGRTATRADEAAAEDMPVNRYVAVFRTGADTDELLCQLRELNQILDYQNKILVEILKHLPNGSAT